MMIDAATRESLELTQSVSGTRAGSLLACIDRTVTGAGARLLAADLGAPLLDRGRIEARLDLVGLFERDRGLRDLVRRQLRALPDIGRALGRLAVGRGGPRDLGQLPRRPRGGPPAARPAGAPARAAAAARCPAAGADRPWRAGRPVRARWCRRRRSTRRRAVTYRRGLDDALDALRATGGEGRRAIAALEARYRDQTGIAVLKIRHNAVLGYHIEVPARHADRLMAAESGFTHRQTLAGVVRFNAPDLHEQAMRVAQAGANALAAEEAHLEALIIAALGGPRRSPPPPTRSPGSTSPPRCRARRGGRLVAAPVRPTPVRGRRRPPSGGRGGAQGRGRRFVANDCRLRENSRLWLVTGPNMGGKSTFLRQNALIAILAQAGGYVPAASATLDWSIGCSAASAPRTISPAGRSTFMVEMVETAAILAQATARSFVILDEVGRGTSTYDGLAIAWAVVEAIHDRSRCRCLFATHYPRADPARRTARRAVAPPCPRPRMEGRPGPAHEVASGPADRSYGIAVAKLAGLPPPVLARAKSVLAKLEEGRAATGGIAAGLDDLPLFAAAPPEEAVPDPLHAALAEIEPDTLSPREALELVYRLKRLQAEKG